ncbi:MAG: IS1380 family transposase [Candidatus Eisenbacteria bacterium]
MKRAKLVESLQVVADADRLTSRAGTALLSGLADRVGLTGALSQAMGGVRKRRSRHDPGRTLRDLAVMIADGGDCLTDLRALRDQPTLFGDVASDATGWRALAALDTQRLAAVRRARATARARVWELAGAPERMALDLDATLVTAHSDKEQAAGTYKHGFGFHPLLCYEATTEEALAGILRPGNAGANTACDHVELLDRALEQLPEEAVGPGLLVRADSGGASHAFLDHVASLGLCFSVGFDLTEPVRKAVLAVSERAWRPALTQAGEQRDGAAVAELALDLSTWPSGTRAICRRERPHPGAQLSFTDDNGYRFQVFISNQRGGRIERLEQLHRQHAVVEDRIRCGKDTGLANLPFRGFRANAAWPELALCAQDLLAWTQRLLLEGELARCEPKRLRYRLLHVAGRLTQHARRLRLHLPRGWAWGDALLQAFARLRALPQAP